MLRTDLTLLKSQFAEELKTDHFYDDVTSRCLKEKGQQKGTAILFAKEEGVFSGESVVVAASQILPQIEFLLQVKEGQKFEAGTSLLQVQGKIGELLSLERTLLNFLGHASGVATLTHRYVQAVGNPAIKVLATRKTLPGLKDLELQAVVSGGGNIHRRSLSDGILFKDNHIALLSEKELLLEARKSRSPLHRVEIEVQNLTQLNEVLLYAPDVIMLDNMSYDDMKKGIAMVREKFGKSCALEISGGVSLEKIGELAKLDVDYISVGKITHSAPWLNLSMDFKT